MCQLLVAMVTGLCLLTQEALAVTINAEQQGKLIALWDATDGMNWKDQLGFVEGVPACKTASVDCDSGGNVIGVHLSSNNLNGTIPSDFLTGLPALGTINLNSNFLHGSVPVPGDALQNLLLHFNDFSGSLPTGFWAPSLNQVQLTGNAYNKDDPSKQLSGTIGGDIANSKQLVSVFLGYNDFTGAIPPAICGISTFTTWSSPVCGFTSWPDDLDTMENLNTLILSNNGGISGTIPEKWCKRAWEVLDLDAMPQLTGTLPDCFASEQNDGGAHWQTFSIQGTGITIDQFPAMFFNMPRLETLEIGPMTGTIPKDGWNTKNFGKLETLGLTGIGIYGTIPDEVFQLPELAAISLTTTGLVGTLPSLRSLSKLHTLNILNNEKLGGTFPVELVHNHWKFLPKHWNSNISGIIPPARSINIQGNAFNGTLPDFAPDEIPTYLANDTSSSVILSKNDWQGYIPQSFELWVTNMSMPNILAECRFLFHPIPAWQKYMVGNLQHGFRMYPQSTTPNKVSWAGSQDIVVEGGDFLEVIGSATTVYCGFCIPRHEADLSKDCEYYYDFQNYTVATWVGPRSYSCTSPPLPKDGGAALQTYKPIHIGIIYHGPTTNSTKETHLLSIPSEATFSMYNPHPKVYSVHPPLGRREGCSLVTIKGSGFYNAPASRLAIVIGVDTWEARHDNETIVINGTSTIVDDETLTVLIPFASTTLVDTVGGVFNTKYKLQEKIPYAVNVYPGGLEGPKGVSNATYGFTSTCDTPLARCDLGLGLRDPEHCPTPVCRCHGTGFCFVNTSAEKNITTVNGVTHTKPQYDCNCLGAYRGVGCDQCTALHFGAACSKCKCVSGHGTCEAGITGSGHCNCFHQYIGSECAINWHYLAIFLPSSIALVVAAGCCFRCYRKRKNRHDGLLDGGGGDSYQTN